MTRDGETVILEPIYAHPLRDYSVKETLRFPSWEDDWGMMTQAKKETGWRWATWQDLEDAPDDYGYPYSHVRIYELHGERDGYICTQEMRDAWQCEPTNLLPKLWEFFSYHNYDFQWRCDSDHHDGDDSLTCAQPLYISGYTGNGGVGIEVSGWICEDCPDPESLCWNCDHEMEDGKCVNAACSESADYVDPDEYDSESE